MICTPDLFLPPSGDYGASSILYTDAGNGAAANLTGYTASVVDVTGVLASAVTASLPDAAAGAVRIAVAWQGGWPVAPGLLGTFRLSLVNGSDEIVTEPVTVYVQGVALSIEVSRGSDMSYAFTWPDDRDGASLTGETVDVINASVTLAPLVSVEVLDAATRACRLHVEGDLAVAVGNAGSFQLRRRVAGAAPRTLAPVAVVVK